MRHPWELARFDFFHRVLGGDALRLAPLSVLDIGAGDGWFSESLGRHLGEGSRIVCWDANYADDHLQPFDGQSIDGLSFTRDAPEGTFDTILLLDVLEHIEDDHGFLSIAVANHVEPGTRILISVPAGPSVYSRHDAHFGHFRRYTPSAARALIDGAGLDIVQAGGLFHGLLPARAIMTMLERRRNNHEEIVGLGGWTHGPLVTGTVTGILRLEGAMSRIFASVGIDVPGLSWWALCEKRRS